MAGHDAGLKMGKPPATLGDIAKSLGTSIGTVHRALHDHPGVSAATKARVQQMARTLGGFAVEVQAIEASFTFCRNYIWVRLSGKRRKIDVLFRARD